MKASNRTAARSGSRFGNLGVFLATLALAGGIGVLVFFIPKFLGKNPPRDASSFLPQSTSAFVHFDPSAFASSTLGRSMLEGEGRDEGTAEVEETCGFQPFAELRSIDMMIVEEPSAPNRSGAALWFGGNIDTAKWSDCITALLHIDQAEQEELSIAGRRAIRARDGIAIFLQGEGVLAGSSQAILELVLKVHDGQSVGLDANSDLRARIRRLPRGTTLSAVWNLPSDTAASFAQTLQLQALESASKVSGWVVLGEVARAVVQMPMPSNTDAASAQSAFVAKQNEWRSHPMIQFSGMAGLLAKLHFEAKGSALELSFELSRDEVRQLLLRLR